MITIEEKLNVFTKLVLGHVQLEFEEKYNEISKENEEIIDNHSKKLQIKKEKIIYDYSQKGKNDRSKLISQANIDKKRQILNKKQEFIERIVEDLYIMAEEFCCSHEYAGFLKRMLREALPRFSGEKSLRICMNPRDIKEYFNLVIELGKSLGFSQDQINPSPAEKELIGGFVIYNEDMTLKVDSSINTIIEENRLLVGQKIYDALQESGDENA